jgi:ATP-dependent Lon protease
MEVLDPEQNYMFVDHYLDVEYDLSSVFFICTANVLHTIPPALQDRMEIIRLSGYTEDEKVEIATRFLVKRQRQETGLDEKKLSFTREGLVRIIQEYTREAGVRNLEREIGNICRKTARRVVRSKEEVAITITPGNVQEFLGVPKFRDLQQEKKNEVGAAIGLAWTEVGGQILNTETTLMEGKGKLMLTGKLGDVMQESAQAAMSYVRSRSHQLGLPRDFYRNLDVHLHVPEGAIPKDGPSAGITIATTLVSALTKIAVRSDVAMTGEITLRGKVLPIGGLKEKLLAAHRHSILEVVLPKDNEKDLPDIPENVRGVMKLHFVEHMDEVLQIALERPLDTLSVPLTPAVELTTQTGAEDVTH